MSTHRTESFSSAGYRTGLRLYAASARRYPTSVMPTHQATAMTALLPIGVHVSNPRSVSMMGVKG